MSKVPMKYRPMSEYLRALLKRALRVIAEAQAAGQTVTARRIGQLLNMSDSSGLEIRAALVRHGFLEVLAPAGAGRPSRVRITEDGWTLIGIAPQRAAEEGTERRCLRCGNPFLSEGAHHRLCTPCRNSDDFRIGAVEFRRVA